MNTAFAYEAERQHKKKLLGPPPAAMIHSVQSNDIPVDKNGKSPVQQKLLPAVVSQLEGMRSEMALL